MILIITAATLWWIPLIGLVFTVPGFLGNRRPPGWARVVTTISLVLALLVNAAVAYELLTE